MKKSFVVSAIVLGAGILGAGMIALHVANAQTTTEGPSSISYPVVELGDCANQTDCRAYCNDTSHMQACIAFAKAHDLITNDQAMEQRQFASLVQAGGGPGGCASPTACDSYCSSINHLNTCIAFAKQHGFSDQKVAEGEKMLSYLNSGGTMPGGCTSQASCEAYCNNVQHMEECVAFAQKTGMNPPEEGGNQMTLDQAKKFAELAQEGKTPGGCTTGDVCRTYCNNPSHDQECSQFAEELGIQAGQMQTFQPGPGGCASSDACNAYCNNPVHRDECIQFGEKHGLIDQGQARMIQQGVATMQEGFSNISPHTASCLQNLLGAQTFENMKNGSFTPAPDVMQKMQQCFGRGEGEQGQPQNARQQNFMSGPGMPSGTPQGNFGPYNGSSPQGGNHEGGNPCEPGVPCNPNNGDHGDFRMMNDGSGTFQGFAPPQGMMPPYMASGTFPGNAGPRQFQNGTQNGGQFIPSNVIMPPGQFQNSAPGGEFQNGEPMPQNGVMLQSDTMPPAGQNSVMPQQPQNGSMSLPPGGTIPSLQPPPNGTTGGTPPPQNPAPSPSSFSSGTQSANIFGAFQSFGENLGHLLGL